MRGSKGLVLKNFKLDFGGGEMQKFRIGDEVTALKRPDQSGFTRVRTASGERANIPTDYVDWSGNEKGSNQ